MNPAGMLTRALPSFFLIVALAPLAIGCGGDPAPAPSATPTPAELPTATPTAEASLDAVISSLREQLQALSTAGFRMIDEHESGQQFYGMNLKDVAGVVRSPDSFRMDVSVESPALGFVKIEMMAVGEESYVKFSEGSPWVPLPLEDVPFNFGGLGSTLSDLLGELDNPSIVGMETVNGNSALRLEADVMSEQLGDLITSADTGHEIDLTFWIEEATGSLTQLRIDGRIFNDDAEGTSRLISISDINEPVEIELPEIDLEP